MSSLIQIRNVPDEVHERLKARAAVQGKSLNSLMLELVQREAATPTKDDVIASIRARGPLGRGIRSSESAELIRSGREERDAQLMAAFSERAPMIDDDRP